jgi:hypothetical protein
MSVTGSKVVEEVGAAPGRSMTASTVELTEQLYFVEAVHEASKSAPIVERETKSTTGRGPGQGDIGAQYCAKQPAGKVHEIESGVSTEIRYLYLAEIRHRRVADFRYHGSFGGLWTRAVSL